jgi:hypothetical protein
MLSAMSLKAQQDPRKLVSRMVSNELSAQKHVTYWMHRETDQEGGKTQVKEVIEMPQCWLTWPVSYNGSSPSAAQLKQARQNLNKLINDPDACHRNRAAIDEDSRKSEALLKMLPDAFLFTSQGEQGGKIRLGFRPNPKFQPPSREAKVFHDMQGTLVIDQKETRLVSLSGQLMSDVNFGAGILGKLRKGGTFHVEQTQVAPNDWELSLLDVHIEGRALLFKTISEQQHQVSTDFKTLPSGLSLAQAASLLQKEGNGASA